LLSSLCALTKADSRCAKDIVVLRAITKYLSMGDMGGAGTAACGVAELLVAICPPGLV